MTIYNFKKIIQLTLSGSISMYVIFTAMSVSAANDWGNYRGVDRKAHTSSRFSVPHSRYGDPSSRGHAERYDRPFTSSHYSIRPPVQHPTSRYQSADAQSDLHQGYSHRGYSYQDDRSQSGIRVIYQQSFPQQTQYHSEQYGWINGDINSSIESSNYMLISDWRRYHLPDPAMGMHWIYQNGRYLQIPNDH